MRKIQTFSHLIPNNGFAVKDEILIIATKSCFFKINTNTNEKTIILNNEIFIFHCYKNVILYQKENGGNLFVYNQGITSEIEGKLYLHSIILAFDNMYILGKDIDNQKYKYEIDFINNLATKTGFPLIIDGILSSDTYFYQALGCIFCYLFNGDILWQVDLRQFKENYNGVNGILTYQNYLFIPINGLVILDIKTGELVHRTQEMGYIIALYEDKIYSVWNNIVYVLNTSNFSIEKIDFSATLLPFGLEMDRVKFAINKNEFYFVHQKEETIVGVLDLKTKQLLWQTTIEIEEGSYWIAEIKVHQNRLYVHTQGGTLHIFERENELMLSGITR